MNIKIFIYINKNCPANNFKGNLYENKECNKNVKENQMNDIILNESLEKTSKSSKF